MFTSVTIVTPMRNLTNRLKSPVMFRRVMTVPLVSLSALLLVGGPAAAEPAFPGGTTSDFPFTVPPCDFPVSATTTAKFVADPTNSPGPPNAIRTVLPNGLSVVTGPAIATVTRTGGKTITYNISGPGKIDFNTGFLSLKGQ